MNIKKLLVANRGEIAVRIIRAARELGLRTVQVYSDADAESLAVRMADEAVSIGPPQAAKSYLNAEAVLSAAEQTGADAVHPGYGFFSENPDFSDAVSAAGLTFVGPDGDTIRLMGDKAAARAAAAAAGVPTAPGSPARIESIDEARSAASETGFPVMVKAAAGGGGRGIRVINNIDEFERHIPQARAEAEAAFGDGGVYIEKFIPNARHIEVQILGDGERVVHCFERECSLQRRRQKIWEEAPAVVLSSDVRSRLCTAAAALAQSVGYKGAGTVEFLYDEKTQDFYFIEMNTRIQVEHPVTELVTGIDLVREMIRICGGEPLSFIQENINVRGHAIEVRINAEDPSNNFMPFPGTVTGLSLPGGPGVRFDGMIYAGAEIPPFYDSLLGKLLVWDESRSAAISRLNRALGELRIDGVKTTAPLFRALAVDDEINAAQFDTQWLEQWLEKNTSKLASWEV